MTTSDDLIHKNYKLVHEILDDVTAITKGILSDLDNYGSYRTWDDLYRAVDEAIVLLEFTKKIFLEKTVWVKGVKDNVDET